MKLIVICLASLLVVFAIPVIYKTLGIKAYLVKMLYQISMDDYITGQVRKKCQVIVDAVTTAASSGGMKHIYVNPCDIIRTDENSGISTIVFCHGPEWARTIELKKMDKIAVFIQKPIGLIEVARRIFTSNFIRPDIFTIFNIDEVDTSHIAEAVSFASKKEVIYSIQRFGIVDEPSLFPENQMVIESQAMAIAESCSGYIYGIYDLKEDEAFDKRYIEFEEKIEHTFDREAFRKEGLRSWRSATAKPMSEIPLDLLSPVDYNQYIGRDTALIRHWDYPEIGRQDKAQEFLSGLFSGRYPEISDGKTIVSIDTPLVLRLYGHYAAWKKESKDVVIRDYKNRAFITAINPIVPVNNLAILKAENADNECAVAHVERIAIPLSPADKYDGLPRFLVIEVEGGVVLDGIYNGREKRVIAFFPKK